MSLEFSSAYNLLKSLAEKVGGKTDLTEKDIKKLMKDADTDGDGVISKAEFKDVYMSTEEYQNLEKEYLEAFESISGLDGEEGLSEEDIISAKEKIDSEKNAQTSNSGGGDGGGAPSNGGGPAPKNNTQNPENNSNGNLDPISLSEKHTMDELSTKRNEALNTLDTQREAKENAVNTAKANTDSKQEAYNNATDAFANKLAEKGEQMTEKEKNIVNCEDKKDAVNAEIDSQESIVSTCKSNVSECQANISSIQGEISSLGSAPPTTIPVEDEDGNETSIPNPAYEAWVAQKESLEAKLAEAENALADCELELADAEEILTGLEKDLSTVETELNTAIDDYMKTEAKANEELKNLQTDINNTSKAYNDAKTEEAKIEQPFDAQIQKAKDDLKAYDEAMNIEEMPQEWSNEDKTGLEKVDKADIPAEYTISEGKILDSEGNEVGKVVESENSDENSEPKYYLDKPVEKPNMSFLEMYDMAEKLATGEIDGEFNPDKAWGSIDFSKMSSEDITKVAELYEEKVSENKADAIKDATKDIPSTFLDAAEQYLSDEEGTASQFKEIVGGLLKESEENEKAAEMLTNKIDSALESGDTDTIDALLANANSNYSAFMNYLFNTGLPAKVQTKMGENADELLSQLYSKVDQHKESDAESYGIEAEKAEELQEDYLSGNTDADLNKIIDAINDGTLSNPDEINYLLAQCGDSSKLMSAANKLIEEGKFTEDDLNTIFKVSTTKQAEIMEAINEDSQLKAFIEEKGLNAISSTQKDLEEAIKEFEETNSSSDVISDEQRDKFLNGGLDKALENIKDDPAKIKDTVNKMMDDIINSKDLSPNEKTKLLQEIKNYSDSTSESVKEYLGNNDKFLADTLDEMSKNSEEFSTQDKIDFLKEYVVLQESLQLFNDDSFMKNIVDNSTVEQLVEIFEDATPAQRDNLMQYISPSVIASGIQNETSLGTETKLLERLINAVSSSDESGKMSTDSSDYGLKPEEAEEIKNKYLSGNTSKEEQLEEVLKAIEDEKILDNEAKYLLSEIGAGSPEEIIDIFRNLDNASQEIYIKELFSVFQPEQKIIEEVKEEDTVNYAQSSSSSSSILANKGTPFGLNNGFELIKGEDGTSMSYSVVTPNGIDPTKEVPVIVYLHGANGSERTLYNQIMKEYNLTEGFNGYIICPTVKGNWNNENAANDINEILNTFSLSHNIDKDNIVLVGHSLGGSGALYLPNSPVFNTPNGFKFKKAAAITGYPTEPQSYNIPVGLWVDSGSKWKLDNYVLPGLDINGKDKYVDLCYYSHGQTDNIAFTQDTNGNGRADLLEWLFE